MRWACLLLVIGCGEAAAVSETWHADDTSAVAARPVRPLPGQARGRWALELNEACTACHAEEEKAWSGSRHHHADTNEAYRSAFEREPSAFCTGCHAPEGESELGVGCVTCHVVGTDDDFVVLAAAGDAAAPHRVLRSDDFGKTGACASCHQFRFPGRHGDAPAAFMQTTLMELDQIAPEASCLDCHMQDHGFGEVRDADWLRKGLTVTASATESGGVELRFAQTTPGHAYPTGDLFRRLQLGVVWVDAAGRALERQTHYLGRHFELGARGRVEVTDDRVREESVVALEPSTRAHALRWWVTLQRVGTVGTGNDPDAALIESEQRLHAGTLISGEP